MDTLTRRISTLHLRKKPSTAIVQGSVASRGSNLTTCTSFMSSGSLPNDPVNTPPPTYSRLVPRIFYYPEGTTDAIPKTTHSKAALTSAFDAAACKRPQATQANVQCFMVGSGRDIQLQIFTENGPHEEDYKTLAQTLGTLHLKYLVFDMEYLSCPTCINDLKSQAQNERSWFHRNVVANPSWTGKRYRINCRHEPIISNFLVFFSQHRPLENIKLLKVKLTSLHDPDMLASATHTILTYFPKLEELVLELPKDGDDDDATIEHLTRIKLKSCVRRLDAKYEHLLKFKNPDKSDRHVEGWRKYRP